MACFALEAGTILQDLVDYTGDGYGGAIKTEGTFDPSGSRRRKWFSLLNLLVAIVLVAGTWVTVAWYFSKKTSGNPAETKRPPFAEVTVYGRDSKVSVTLPPPWDDVRGMPIDGGMVFRLPAKTREEVDAIRRKLDAEPTLREKRGKPLTYDIVAFYDLVSDDIDDVKRTIGMFAADRFLVRIEGESNGVLRVSTISPRGFRARLKQVYNLKEDVKGFWNLTSKADRTRSRTFAGTNAPP